MKTEKLKQDILNQWESINFSKLLSGILRNSEQKIILQTIEHLMQFSNLFL